MKPTFYGWSCDKCKHREVDRSRQSVIERDRPPEFPWVSCDCDYCKGKTSAAAVDARTQRQLYAEKEKQ